MNINVEEDELEKSIISNLLDTYEEIKQKQENLNQNTKLIENQNDLL